jgi:peptidoglycan/xylan/chitin deacetylase (PgdA/CDA1 family)
MFHQVNDDKKPFYPATRVEVFEGICKYLSKHHKVIHVSEVEDHFKNSNESAVIISFDDGHADIMDNVLPIVSRHGLKFNINIDTEVLETGLPQDFVRVYDMINQVESSSYFDPEFMKDHITINREQPVKTEYDFTQLLTPLEPAKRRVLVERMRDHFGRDKVSFSKMLSAHDLKLLREKGAEIGAHTHTHADLTQLPAELVNEELSKSKTILENITATKIDILAFPNGQFNQNVEELARNNGFRYLLKTEDKINVMAPLKKDFFRINQYYTSVEESLASMYGFHGGLRKLRKYI